MAKRSEVLGALQGLGGGVSKMGMAIMERERMDTQTALQQEESERAQAEEDRKAKLFPDQQATAAAGATQAKTLASEALSMADKRKSADAANQALMAENEAAGWAVDPDDQGQVGTWKSELNALNRYRAKESKPAMSVAEYVTSKKGEKLERTKLATDETRKGETHKSDLATAGAQRRLLGAQVDKTLHEATKPPKASELPVDVRTEATTLASKVAGKKAIANQLDADLVQLRKALGLDEKGNPVPGAQRDENLAVNYAQSMLKTMNSKEGADAVGIDEAKRSAGLLEYNIADAKAVLGMKPGKFHGRDLDGFLKQVTSITQGVRGSVDANQGEIDRLLGRTPVAPAQASSQDSEAVEWAKANSNDPRAKKILQMNGVR